MNHEDRLALATALEASLAGTIVWKPSSERNKLTNSLRSARFCSEAACAIHRVFSARLGWGAEVTKRHIVVEDSGERLAGEWLLDAVWSEQHPIDAARPTPGKEGAPRSCVPYRLRAALESESNVSEYEFFIDLAKLAAVRCPIKIFLGGVNQRTAVAMNQRIAIRLRQTADFLDGAGESPATADWLVGFWPSPAKPSGTATGSLWKLLLEKPEHEHLKHLKHLTLFWWNTDGEFVPVNEPARQVVRFNAR